jgi:tetratricopeptide (TPR) repeat protein
VNPANPLKNPLAWLALAIFLLTIVIYMPGLSGDYMFDDRANLLENKRLDMETLNLHNLADAALSSGSGDLRRPVSMASFALNRYFFGVAPYSHKVVNLVIHLLTGAGLWLLGCLIIRSYRLQPAANLSAGVARWLPLVVAGLWLVHPLNLSTVLYIVQRMAGLSALFSVFGLCLYLHGRMRMQAGSSGMPYILTGLLLFGGLAVFSKENGVLLPLYMLVLEATLFRFKNRQGKLDKRMLGFFTLTLTLPALLALLVLIFDPDKLVNYGVRTFNMQERVLTEARVLVFYLKMIIVPTINELGLYHDDIVISRGLLDPPATLVSILLLACLFVTAVSLTTRNALFSLGILWFFAGHMLESTVISLEIAHEHRNYLADYGILFAVCAFIARARMHQLGPVIRIGGPAVLLLMLSYTTWLRAGQWSDNINHALTEAEHHPQSPRAVFAAGRIYARLALEGIPDTEQKAFDYLDRASQLDKEEIMPDTTIVALKYYLGRPVDEVYFATIKQKLNSAPVQASDIVSLQTLVDCFGSKCNIPAHELEEMFAIALEKSPSTILQTIYGYYRINKQSDFQTGLQIFRKVVDQNPREPQHWINLVNLLLVMGRIDEAETQLERLMDIDLHGSNQSTRDLLRQEIDNARQFSAGHSSQSTVAGELQ